MVSSKRNSISTNPNSSASSSSTNHTSNIMTTEGNSGTNIPRATTSSNISTATNKTITISEKDVKHLASECAVCSKFKEGERVLCFEPDPTKVRVVYEAKILQISVTSDEKTGKSTHEFLVHFQGWNASWDRFVPQSYLLKNNQDNRNLQRTLFQKAELLSKSKKKKKKKKSEMLKIITAEAQATRSEDSSTAGTDGEEEMDNAVGEPCTSHSNVNPSLTSEDASFTAHISQDKSPITLISTNEKISQFPTKNNKRGYSTLICPNDDPVLPNSTEDGNDSLNITPIQLSDALKQHLEEDYINVNKKRRLTRVPAEPSAISVLEDYVRHYAAARMVSYEKQRSKTFYTSNRKEEDKICYEKAVDSINIAKEVAEGVRILMDFNLETLLLYGESGEQDQYNRIANIADTETSGTTHKGEKCIPNSGLKYPTNEQQNYQASSSKEALTEESKENIMVEGSKVNTPLNNADPKPNLLSITALRERRKFSLSIESKTSSTIESENGVGRHGILSGGCSSRDSTTSGRSSATPTQSLLNPPATSPTTPQATQLLRSVHEWRLVPPNLLKNSNSSDENVLTNGSCQQSTDAVIIPSSLYGPVHLLRLFVKMPEIIARMQMPQKTSKLIMKYLDSLLGYLERQPNLFTSESVYE